MESSKQGATPYRLNVGCGRNIRQGWINLDSAQLPGVDVVCDLEKVASHPIDLPDNSVEQFLLSHVIEHIDHSLDLMQDLWRLATPAATMLIRVPHGGSDDAWEDPTHVRPYFAGSFGYFAQPHYWRADYGYRGDWQPDTVRLRVDRSRCDGSDLRGTLSKIQQERNMVREMLCELTAVKPGRAASADLQVAPRIEVEAID